MKNILLISVLWLTALFAQAGTTKITYYVNDPLGSPVVAMNQAGDVIWRKTYEPYGKASGADGDNRVGYTGHVEEQNGLIYAGARYYDPALGIFASDDPVRFNENNPMSFNRYAYANNNPYRYTDPNGKNAEEVLNAVDGIGMGMMGTGLAVGPIPGADLASLPLISVGAVLKGGSMLGRAAMGVDHVASTAKSGVELGKSLASASQMSEAGVSLAGAGAKSGARLKDAERLVSEHGGNVTDWQKNRVLLILPEMVLRLKLTGMKML
jgi:RHS repeat-associated protein